MRWESLKKESMVGRGILLRKRKRRRESSFRRITNALLPVSLHLRVGICTLYGVCHSVTLSLHFVASPCEDALDLGVIVDVSVSIGKSHLPAVKEALQSLVDKFDISVKGTHMGVITFSREAHMLFSFADIEFQNKTAAKKIISEINHLHYQTRTDKALIMADQELFTEAGGDRPDKHDVLVVFTDGKPTPKRGYKGFDVTVPPLLVSGCFSPTSVNVA